MESDGVIKMLFNSESSVGVNYHELRQSSLGSSKFTFLNINLSNKKNDLFEFNGQLNGEES